MRYIKGISIMTIVVLIFHIFGLNAGLLATSEQSTSNEVSVEYVTHSDEDIEWNLVVDVTNESEDDEVNVAIEFSKGLSHGSIDGTNSIDVEQTANGYLLKSSKSIQEEFKITTVRTDDLVDSYQLKAVVSFDGQQIKDFDEKSLEMPVLTQLDETESNEQADESSSEMTSNEEDAEEQVESSEDDEAETEDDTGSSEVESHSEDGESDDSASGSKEKPVEQSKTLDENEEENQKSNQDQVVKQKETNSQNNKVDATKSLFVSLSTSGSYFSGTNAIVVPTTLVGTSQNDHTRPHRLWSKDGTVYVAVKSTHSLQFITLNGVTSTNFDEYNPLVPIYIDGVEYNPKDGLKGNTKDSHWTVFKFPLTDLNLNDDGIYTFFIKGIGGGHDVGGDLLFEIPKTDVTANKVWDGGTERPSITLHLLVSAAGEAPHQIKNATVDGNEIPAWQYTWEEVPQYDPYGREYIFTADEADVPVNYVKSLDGLTVTNTYNPEQIDIHVTKEWIGPAAEAVTVQLFADGTDTGRTLVLNEANNWSDTFADLNVFDDQTGNQISYTVQEIDIPGYSSDVLGSVDNGFVVTNTNDETLDIQVAKEWVGPAANEVTIQLFSGGVDTGEMITLNATNNWSGAFENLRKYDETTGVKIDYIVQEVALEGYTSHKTGSVEEGFTFTNTNDELIDVVVTKEWIGPETGEVTVSLLADGTDTGITEVLNEDNQWSAVFTGFRKYDDETGNEIEYEVIELNVPDGYEASYRAEDGVLIVTNTALYGSLTIYKVDENGDPLAGAMFELNGSDGFSMTGTSDEFGLIIFDELPLGEYTLTETKAPEGYRLLEGERTISISSDQLHVNETIENTLQDWEIPKTGGIGTIGFYGVGAILMATALFLLWRRRKENNE
ncbi:Cna B-type domain-containing protein [Allobacillus sp. SKP2-8]|uniref:Cna B-type domain-containing protein n=1 Tax=unclassified Allobacillus TaxID=2628859 RepID=UPI0011839EFB|nr:Cna B-type domain-containing protein [Allobacillus sp. SKP2-8]TSJ67368.1 Cna B-type domain-containing protein [Allobacillus sp. SKP2-8]